MSEGEIPGASSPGSGNSPNRKVVEGYGPGRFRISGQVHESSVLVLPEQVFAWPVSEFAQVTVETLRPLLDPAAGVELLLFGCGVRMAMVPAELRAALRSAGLAVDAMDTGAAARTYNVLLSENRRVAAALIALEDES